MGIRKATQSSDYLPVASDAMDRPSVATRFLLAILGILTILMMPLMIYEKYRTWQLIRYFNKHGWPK